MMKRILSLALALLLAMSAVAALAEDIAINAKNFPDKTFREAVAKLCDTNQDGKLSAKEVKAVKRLELDSDTTYYDLGISGAIKSLVGIEKFPNLVSLSFDYQNVKTLDVSKNTKLTSLAGSWNTNLKTVTLGKQKSLNALWLTHTKLKKLDIGGCPKLIKLLGQYDGTEGFGQVKGGPCIDSDCKLYNGKKLATKNAKPKKIAFKKKSVSVTRKQLENNSAYDLGIYLVLEPAGTVWPIKYSSSNSDFIECDEAGGAFWFNTEAKKGATATLTAKCGGKTATIKVTLK